MINHARTVLINQNGPHNEQTDIPGDVYIPEYETLTLSAPLRVLWDTLFGGAPDYEGVVYRAAQYMAVLHSTEYEAYVTALDPRITYDTNNINILSEGIYGPIVTGPSDISVTGTWDDEGMSGRVNTRWRVLMSAADRVLIENQNDGWIVEYDWDEVKKLPRTDLAIAFADTSPAAGTEWFIDYKSRPQPDIGAVLASLRTLPRTTQTTIFGSSPKQEPQLTFYNLARKHYALPYQLSGWLLAFIYALDALRVE